MKKRLRMTLAQGEAAPMEMELRLMRRMNLDKWVMSDTRFLHFWRGDRNQEGR